jgi:hypothetical protein
MMLLSLHVVAVGLLILVVGSLAYRLGYDKAERRYRRAMQYREEDKYDAEGKPTA